MFSILTTGSGASLARATASSKLVLEKYLGPRNLAESDDTLLTSSGVWIEFYSQAFSGEEVTDSIHFRNASGCKCCGVVP
jgi:hypothetical protein